ncbi:23S rRNA pseudouridine(2604) synthase RluF [Thiomicrorhabdus chilensis]|uniref:23S rRNA pseudouridine(2604) synthase RluF n=1 Tax=Thiomicrorhabdus chilensis TaxID=63656 RepID=UPI00041299F1|nr:23S rRNA pseudouridine(2604) synthase RluF [Thiomicrorhabdus chilensis]
MTSSSGKRLNKFISESGFCSRREADKLIEQNRVKINGKIPELGTKVQPGDKVEVDGKTIKPSAANKSDRTYIAYNKPIGIICSTESRVKGNIIDAIGHPQRIFPIGRLDKPSEGLIFLTSDGDIVNKILRAENAHDKEYIVTVDKPLSDRFVERMSRGVPILGTVTKPCKVNIVSRFVFKIILTQGLNRQIRRMCEYLGYEVTKLKRTRIMSVELGNLKPGQWRNLTAKEMDEINRAVAGSTKTATSKNGTNPTQIKTKETETKRTRRPARAKESSRTPRPKSSPVQRAPKKTNRS